MSRRFRFDRRGFTLLEATLALVVLGATIAALAASSAAQLRAAGRARHTAEATALAQQRLASLRLLEAEQLSALPDSLAGGRFAEPFQRYGWTALARPVAGEPGLFDLRLAVAWEGGEYPLWTRVYRAPAPERR